MSDSNVIEVSDEDSRMNAAMAEARATVKTFIDALEHPKPGVSGFAVKIPLDVISGTEHVWANKITFDGTQFRAVVNSPPEGTTDVKLGDQVTVGVDNISDWMYLEGRRLIGGLTIRAVRDGLSDEERTDFDANAPFRFDAPEGGGVAIPSDLEGVWELVSVDAGNGPSSPPGIRMRISTDSVAMVNKDGAAKPLGRIVELHPNSTPKGIDLANSGGIGRGIYELSGTDLKLIVGNPDQPRPTQFKGQPRGMLFLMRRGG